MMGKFYEDLKEGLQDVIAYQKGKTELLATRDQIHLHSEVIEVVVPSKPASKPKEKLLDLHP